MSMESLIHKSHNVTQLMYHMVFVAKYRKSIFTQEVDSLLAGTCLELSERYEIYFKEIGTDENHVHFMLQSVPRHSVPNLVKIIKSITAREIFKGIPSVKKWLWGGEFWTDGYYAGTVGFQSSQEVVRRYIKEQGRDPKKYKSIHQDGSKYEQLTLF